MRIAASSRSSTDRPGGRAAAAAQSRREMPPGTPLTIGSTCSRPNRIGAVTASSPRGALPCPAAACSISARSASTRCAPPRKRSPDVGQAHGPGGAVEQAHAEPRLEIGDRAGHRGRRAVELPRGRREAAALRRPRRTPRCLRSGPYYPEYRNNQLRTIRIIARPDRRYIRAAMRSAMSNNSELVFPPAVRRAQAERGSAAGYAKKVEHGFPDTVTPELAAFIAEQDTAFLGTASADGAPYIQHRGGPKGFIKVVDEQHARLRGLPRQPAVHHARQPVGERPRLPVPDRFLAPPAHQAVGPRPRGRERRCADRRSCSTTATRRGPSA